MEGVVEDGLGRVMGGGGGDLEWEMGKGGVMGDSLLYIIVLLLFFLP